MKNAPYEAYVDNIGMIGRFPSKTAAIRAIRETIRNSGRADPHGFVMDADGELVAEIGRPAND